MARIIDAVQAAEIISDRLDIPIADLVDVFADIPTVNSGCTVRIVRCKECEHGEFMAACSKYKCRKVGGSLRFADDFCNYAKKEKRK